MRTPTHETLGPYVAGERPEKWTHAFLDAAGAPIDISSWLVNTTWRLAGGTQVERAGVIVSGAAGTARHTWHAGDIDVPGLYVGEMTVSGGGLILSRTFELVALPPRGGAL